MSPRVNHDSMTDAVPRGHLLNLSVLFGGEEGQSLGSERLSGVLPRGSPGKRPHVYILVLATARAPDSGEQLGRAVRSCRRVERAAEMTCAVGKAPSLLSPDLCYPCRVAELAAHD